MLLDGDRVQPISTRSPVLKPAERKAAPELEMRRGRSDG
jgi:hypothetical protein